MGTEGIDAKENTMMIDESNEVITTKGDDEIQMEKVSESEPETNQESGVSIDANDDGSAKGKAKSNDDIKCDDNKDDDTESTDEKKIDRSREEKEKEAKEKEEAEKKRMEELKEKYKDWPLKNIKDPHENDVLYGRGGGTNHHKGNKKYRKMVENRKLEYVNSKRNDKPLVALEIVRIWRAQLPPGRFLKHNDKTGHWDDVEDKKAR